MAGYRKLHRPQDQRKAMLRGLVTSLIWHGRVVTTQARAKEVAKITEKLITLAMTEFEGTEITTIEKNNEKGQTVSVHTRKDTPAKLHVRRQLMAYLYDIPEAKKEDESKADYKERTKDVKFPVIEKLFGDLAPRYAKRKEEKGTGGGYTRILKTGPRRGDATEMAIVELI